MLLSKFILLSFLVHIAEASKRCKRKKETANASKLDLASAASMASATNVPTTSTTAPITSTASSLPMASSSTTADSGLDLESAYNYEVSIVSKYASAKKEREGSKKNSTLDIMTWCSGITCPDLPLDQVVAQDSICITNPKTLRRILSNLLRFVATILPSLSMNPGNEKAVIFHDKLQGILLAEFPACALTPERFLSVDFAAVPDLRVKDAIDYAEFLKLFLEPRDDTVSLPAVYMLNAFFQLDSMLHSLLLKKHELEELELLFQARRALLHIARKKAHYESVSHLMSSSFSKTVRLAMNNGQPANGGINIARVLESVDAIVSQGANPENRAYVYAKEMGAFLLTEDAVQLQFCKDDEICQEPYATADFPLWLFDVLNFERTPSRFNSTLDSALTSGNRKLIYNMVDYISTVKLFEAMGRLSYDQKYSASPDLACKPYTAINFMIATFQPLLKEINTKHLLLKECLSLNVTQQPKCIYRSIVRTFANFEFVENIEEFQDFVKFLFKEYNKYKFWNNNITQEVHEEVHEMIVKGVGGEFHEKILLKMLSTELDTINDFDKDDYLEDHAYVFPGKAAMESLDSATSEYIVRGYLTKRNYIFRERHSYKRLGLTDDPNGLNHYYIANIHESILIGMGKSEELNSFYRSHSLTPLARTYSILCKPIIDQPGPNSSSDIQEAHGTALLHKADHIVKVLCTNPLLFSSSLLQRLLGRTINEALHSDFKTAVAAFVWDYYATRGIDASCFLCTVNHQLSDVSLPYVAMNSKMVVQSRLYCNFAYMSLMPIVLMVSSPSDVSMSDLTFALDHMRSVFDAFMKDQNVAPHYHHAMITAISRAIMRFEPELTCTLLSKYWNQPRLIEALELLPYDKVRDISSNSKLFGPMALSALLSRHGKAFLFDDNPGTAYYGQFMVDFLEHDKLNDAHFIRGYTNYFIAFIREAVALAPGVLKVEISSDRICTRLQLLFNPSFEFKESDLVTIELEKCSSQRKVVHRMIREIIDTENSEVHAILIQVLYRHYKYCKIWLSTNKSSHKENGKVGTENQIPADEMRHIAQLYPTKGNTSQKFAVTASLARPQNASNTSKHLQEPNKINHQTNLTQSPKTSISGTTISENDETPVKPKEVHTKKANLPRKNTAKEIEEDYEDSFNFMAPTPKKTIQKVTELKDDIASYFKCSSNGIRAPSPSLRLGTHELLLKHANAMGFPFLLDENFYNFLVGQEYILDTSSFGNQLDAWLEAKQKVPMNKQLTRLGLWVPNTFKLVTVSKNYPLHSELEKFLNDNVELRNRLVSLLQNSIQGKKSFARISVMSKPLVQKIEVQNGTLSLDSSVSAEILPQLLFDFLTLKMQPIVEEQVSDDNETQSITKTEAIEKPKISQTSISTVSSELNETLNGNNFMAYDGQLQEINSDIDTQAKRIRILRAQELGNKSLSDNDYKQRLQNMKAGNAEKRFVERRLKELVRLISNADYIAVDFELTGVSLSSGSDPSGFEECKQSARENSIVQLGLMLMKKGESDSLVQEDSGKSIWKIPICLKGNTEDSIWRKNSLDFLKANGFDLLAWKVQCLEYSQLDAIWKALLEKPILTHNGLLDVLHLLRAADREIKNVQSTDEFKNFLNNSGINVYDTRVLYNQTHPHFSLTKLSEAVLPRDKLKAGSAHDASYDAYCTGHLCRRFSTASLSSSRNVLIETKRGVKKVQTSQNSSSSQSAQHLTNDTPTRPDAVKRNAKAPSQTSSNSSSLALQDPRTYQEFIPNPQYHQHSTVYYSTPWQPQQSYSYGQNLCSPMSMQMQTPQFDPPQPIRWPLRFQQDYFPLNNINEKNN